MVGDFEGAGFALEPLIGYRPGALCPQPPAIRPDTGIGFIFWRVTADPLWIPRPETFNVSIHS
jgi:hypothetical protein